MNKCLTTLLIVFAIAFANSTAAAEETDPEPTPRIVFSSMSITIPIIKFRFPNLQKRLQIVKKKPLMQRCLLRLKNGRMVMD